MGKQPGEEGSGGRQKRELKQSCLALTLKERKEKRKEKRERGTGRQGDKMETEKNTTVAADVGLSTISKRGIGSHRFLNKYLVPKTNAKKEKISF